MVGRLVVVLLIAGCTRVSAPGVAPRSCEARAQEYFALADYKPTESLLSGNATYWVSFARADLPVVERGFVEIDHAVVEVGLQADGTWGNPEADPSMAGTSTDDGEPPPLPIAVLAERDAPLSQLNAIRRATRERPMSLVVRIAPRVLMARHRALVPGSPAWLDEPLERGLAVDRVRYFTARDLLPALRARLGACAPEVDPGLQAMIGGAWMEVVGPMIGHGLRRCQCRDADVDALESVVKFVMLTPRNEVDLALLPLPPYDDPRWAGARVQDLVTRLVETTR